jgi:hypothetical protein
MLYFVYTYALAVLSSIQTIFLLWLCTAATYIPQKIKQDQGAYYPIQTDRKAVKVSWQNSFAEIFCESKKHSSPFIVHDIQLTTKINRSLRKE